VSDSRLKFIYVFSFQLPAPSFQPLVA
jgi:hypothetical protein